MKAMVLEAVGSPLRPVDRPDPVPLSGQLMLRVEACAVCRTDLHVCDGDLSEPKLPLIPGHEIVGRVEAVGEGVPSSRVGQRVGVPWLGHTCGCCSFCRNKEENLCDQPQFTGYTRDGGFAMHVVADADYAFVLDPQADPVALAPLLCAGLIGWRSLKKAGDGSRIGLYGFGAAAHIIAQVCRWQGREIYAFSRPGDEAAQLFALDLGAAWAGGSDESPPVLLDAAIIFAPVGELVPAALRAVRKGGRVVCGGIHMSDLPAMPYALIWGERSIVSVANLTRADAEEFFPVARKAGVRTHTTVYSLVDANRALADLRLGRVTGAAVLTP
ncbi:zinc-dependent alcohol dehydrogenase family protein [Rhizobium lentis]|uniref:Zinc-dependent alcohol dehydrogenase family protein n=1 Tax=Rhizobium lentis TaxID=1138194 RepID=A0A9Q3MFI4_9HYPH|nr:zinc-dependent alcohol dehydrogenase family protein [Rhizobium lentis]MBX5013092.1 zinc-dependent alcohol dehydrogenase family protein [Rhizobium lentis]MBX5025780.1 zinc-dependent alcohol dehydrogenase family protein [Rhizobium lentis]MBX5041353.1 zinc-dependent alcohol dehydrogenase family protein [Rhizobium lentis]MBX5051953.1 zinc-dependent alcohol dehydrogenase family protein [Rhizobium lentis]MBX5071609.1 zinc-dependent alcohol dehydrogenase family protein [Rhizobium lentis]